MDNEQIGYRINEIFRLVTTLVEQGKEQGQTLKEHGETLKEHGQILREHGQKLDNLTQKVDTMSGQLTNVAAKVVSHEDRLTVAEKNIADLQSEVH